jgi:hypothetical protein
MSAVIPSARATLRSSDTGPLLRATPLERRTSMAATVVGLAAAGWIWAGPSTRELDEVVRAAAALPAFALGFGVVMIGMAAATDLLSARGR